MSPLHLRFLPLFVSLAIIISACANEPPSGNPSSKSEDPAPPPAAEAEDDGAAADCQATANGENGLVDHQVLRAFSSDGYTFTPEASVLLDQASVPDGVIGPDGSVWVYFVNGRPGQHGVFAARETENGQWQIIDCVRLDGQFEGNAVDPDIIRLPDGRYRLFYFLGHFVTPPQPGDHPIYSAISEDGLNFTVEQELIAVPGVTDPSVVILPDGRWLMAMARPREHHTLLARSDDGYNFELLDTVIEVNGIPELAVLPDGRVRLYLQESLISEDGGDTWTKEPPRFVPSPDPSLVALADGTYVMFYKKFAGQPKK